MVQPRALLVEGLGGSYGPERAVWHRRRPESGPPEEEAWTFEPGLGSWRHEWNAFLDAVNFIESPWNVSNRVPGLDIESYGPDGVVFSSGIWEGKRLPGDCWAGSR